MVLSGLPDGFVIRQAVADDIPHLHAIEARASTFLASFGYPEIASLSWPLEEFAAFIEAGDCRVAAAGNGTLAGFAVAEGFEDLFWLKELSVDPAFGRRGIGSALVAAVGDLARDRGFAAVGLSTFGNVPFNAPFYRRLGYEIVPLDQVGPLIRHRVEAEVPLGATLGDRVHMRRKL